MQNSPTTPTVICTVDDHLAGRMCGRPVNRAIGMPGYFGCSVGHVHRGHTCDLRPDGNLIVASNRGTCDMCAELAEEPEHECSCHHCREARSCAGCTSGVCP